MGYKDPEKQKAYQRAWLKKKREKKPGVVQAVRAEMRERYRLDAIELLGGKCVTCGVTEETAKLEFHHKVPRRKTGDPKIGDVLSTKGWEEIKREVKKCVLTCRQCHLRHHHPRMGQHGTASRYKRGCRCDVCRAWRHEKYVKTGY